MDMTVGVTLPKEEERISGVVKHNEIMKKTLH